MASLLRRLVVRNHFRFPLSASVTLALRSLAAIAISFAFARSAGATVVGQVSNIIPPTTANPTSFPGWTHGDPGWANFAVGGSYAYLGDGWVLSAGQVGYDKDAGITFQTASGPVAYQMAGARVVGNVLVPGAHYVNYGYDHGGVHHFAVSNPSTVQTESGTVSLSQHTDLQLFRINGEPGLPPLRIATEPLPTNFTRLTAPEVVMIGGGAGRVAAQSRWNVTQQSADEWTWTPTGGTGLFQGYETDGVPQKRWGTNRLADPRANGFGDPSDPGAANYANLFSGVVSDSTAVLKITTADGVTRDVLSSMTVYDQQGQPGTSPAPYGISNLEAQAIAGDAGSAVFFKRGGQWELVGIVNTTSTYTDQPSGTAIYGNATMLSDLWHYNQNYLHSIRSIIETHQDYSIMGDVNLDGIVSGDGTGPVASDDLAAFLAGEQYDNGTGQGTITSWKNGDLNRDGRTNDTDLLLLQGALVPEPSAVVLSLLAGTTMSMRRRRRP